jgi:uncharacterized membrane protein YsdA (DUF1294 family)
MNLPEYLLIYLLCWSLVGLLLCWWDKSHARKKRRRIPESALLFAGLCGGCFGLGLGMYLFRHKTKHLKFMLLVPTQCILWLVIWFTLS